jgi:peptidoglycan/LPS O-acetylase OafA/YrhL
MACARRAPVEPTGPAWRSSGLRWRGAVAGIAARAGSAAGGWGGKISFSLYLVHFPILFTLVCWLFLSLSTVLPYAVVVLLCGLIGGAVSLALAVLFERWIDRPAIRWSRAVRAPWLSS